LFESQFWDNAHLVLYYLCAKFQNIWKLRSVMLGNSGKPVTLETSRFRKFVKWVFRNKELAKIWNLEPAKLRSRERAKIWNLEPAKPRSRECAKIRNLEPAMLRSRERAKIWNLEPAKPQSRELAKAQSHEPATMKSGVCEVRESAGRQVRKSWRTKISWTGRFTNQEEAKSKTSSPKVQVWRVN
jgi:hypothetical protein